MSERPPSNADVARIDVGGLRLNRVLGVIEVDFGTRSVRLVFIDHTGGDDVRQPDVPADPWIRVTPIRRPILDPSPR